MVNSNLQMKLIKDSANFINNGTARYIADVFNIINADINAQTISFSAGGPTCCALAQKILNNNKYYCSMIFFNYYGLFGYAYANFNSDSECTIGDIYGYLIK